MNGDTRTISGGCMTVTYGIENRNVSVSWGQVCEVGYEPIYFIDSEDNYLISINDEYLAGKDEDISI